MIELQYFTPSDFEQLMEWSGDAAFLLQWAGPQFKYPLSEDQLMQYIEGANDPLKSDRLIYKAVDLQSGKAVGHISLRIERENRSGRIGRVLVGSSHTRGTGVGLQMIRAVLKVGFDDLKLHRISLGVFDFNHAAIRCYEKAGFVREGLLRDVRKYQDSYWSLIEMSMLEEEWKRTN